jgi:hypothetical protein
LVDEISLFSHAASQQEPHKQVGESELLVPNPNHLRPSYLQCCTGRDGCGSCHMMTAHSCERLFANEVTLRQKRDRSLLTALRKHSEFRPTPLKIGKWRRRDLVYNFVFPNSVCKKAAASNAIFGGSDIFMIPSHR